MSPNSSNSQLSISPDVIGKLFDWVWKHKHSQHDTDEAHEDEPNRFGTSVRSDTHATFWGVSTVA